VKKGCTRLRRDVWASGSVEGRKFPVSRSLGIKGVGGAPRLNLSTYRSLLKEAHKKQEVGREVHRRGEAGESWENPTGGRTL